MARFLSHEPCPKCQSRDNLGRYDDGSAWCFGCGHFEPPARSIRNSRKQQEKEAKPGDLSDIDCTCSTVLPKEPLEWLKQYGITDEEIRCYNICYVLVKGGKWAGTEGLKLGPQLRVFNRGPKTPKAVTLYVPAGNYLQLSSGASGQDTGVFVEDFLSAIKVGRSYVGLPILGAHVPASGLKWASDRFKRVGVWLDSDKLSVAARIVQKGRLLMGTRCFRVWTELDPKNYGTAYIRDTIERAFAYDNKV